MKCGAVGEPSFGIAAPFAVGLALLVSVQAAGRFTGSRPPSEISTGLSLSPQTKAVESVACNFILDCSAVRPGLEAVIK